MNLNSFLRACEKAGCGKKSARIHFEKNSVKRASLSQRCAIWHNANVTTAIYQQRPYRRGYLFSPEGTSRCIGPRTVPVRSELSGPKPSPFSRAPRPAHALRTGPSAMRAEAALRYGLAKKRALFDARR